MKVINPVIKTIDPLFSPVPVSKVIKGQNGIVAIKNTRQEIDYGEIVLLSVLSTIVDEDNSIADPMLLIFTGGSERPFLLPATKINFKTFSGIRALNLEATFRNFIKLLCKQNPNLILDKGTAEFISGKGVKVFNKDISMLSTALGIYLKKRGNSSTDKKIPFVKKEGIRKKIIKSAGKKNPVLRSKIIYESNDDPVGWLFFLAIFLLWWIYICFLKQYEPTFSWFSGFLFFAALFIFVVVRLTNLLNNPNQYKIHCLENTLIVSTKFSTRRIFKKKDIGRFIIKANKSDYEYPVYQLFLQHRPKDSSGKIISRKLIKISYQDGPDTKVYTIDGEQVDMYRVVSELNKWAEAGRTPDLNHAPLDLKNIGTIKKNEQLKKIKKSEDTAPENFKKIPVQDNANADKYKQDRIRKPGVDAGLSLLSCSVTGLILAAGFNYVIFMITAEYWFGLMLVESGCGIGILLGLILIVVGFMLPAKVVKQSADIRFENEQSKINKNQAGTAPKYSKKTLFRKNADNYQDKLSWPRESGIRKGLTILGDSGTGFVITAGLGFLIYKFFPFDGILMAPILALIAIGCAVGTLAGIIKTAVSFVRPTKVVTCPGCGKKHQLFKSAPKYMCTRCRLLLLMGEDTLLRLSACSYCGLQTAVTSDYGCFVCFTCGVERDLSGRAGEWKTDACPECKNAVPEDVLYCKFCGIILNAQRHATLGDSMEWKIGKDAAGHFIFARALLKVIHEGLAETADIKKVSFLLLKLKDALISIEEGFQDTEFRSSAKTILPELDVAYAAILESELSSIQALAPEKISANKALKVLVKEPHISARRRIERMPGVSLESSGSIGKWDVFLMDVEWGPTGRHIKTINDFSNLKDEVSRFAAWRKQQETSGPS